MKRHIHLLILLCLFLLSACGESVVSLSKTEGGKSTPDEQERTLKSLRKVDDYPLYTMTYYGAYDISSEIQTAVMSRERPWACSLFAAFGDTRHKLYGRNFDWEFSPAVLLFTHPPDGYASVSMVDITYLGFRRQDVASLTTSQKRSRLLSAPLLPFDGMNEYGLTVGMAAVPESQVLVDASKPTIGSVRIIRLLLDRARTTDEAIAFLQKYNIDFAGGPPLHYMVADAAGHAATIEWRDGEIQVVRNREPWQVTTNFYLAGSSEDEKEQDLRYYTASKWLKATNGKASSEEAMQLLNSVKQGHTQWSIVYDMVTGNVSVVMAKRYERVHRFHLPMKL
jgi:penicillin V acylase-like amidase (Ntn superfamily)